MPIIGTGKEPLARRIRRGGAPVARGVAAFHRLAGLSRVAAIVVLAGTLTGCGALRAAYHGCAPGSALPAGPDAHVEGHFLSNVLGGEVEYEIAYPRQAPRALVFALPGRGSTADGMLQGLGLSQRLYAMDAARPFALASVDGGVSYWHRRASGEDRAAMFTSEFIPLAERLVRERAHAAAETKLPEALIGDSMGGYGALLIASEAPPGRYRAVAVASPALFTGDPGPNVDAFDGPGDFARNGLLGRRSALRALPIRIDGAEHDPFRRGIDALARALPNVILGREPGCHDDAFFSSVANAQLNFVERYL